MERVNWKKEWYFLLPLLAQWAVYLFVRKQLPEEIATHFTIDDQGKWVANGYSAPIPFMVIGTLVYLLVYLTVGQRMNQYLTAKYAQVIKGMVLLFVGGLDTMLLWSAAHHGKLADSLNTPMMVVMFFLLNAFVFFIFKSGMGNGPGVRPLSGRYYNIIWVLIHLVVSYVTLLPIALTAGIHLNNYSKNFELFLMAFFAILGNITYSIRPNYFIGIRTPWTLKDETVWRKTHQLSGVLLFVSGIVGFLGVLLLADHYQPYFLYGVLIVGVLIPTFFSYLFYRQQHTTTH